MGGQKQKSLVIKNSVASQPHKSQKTPNEQLKFSTLQMEMLVPYYIYPIISKKVRHEKANDVRKIVRILRKYKIIEIITGVVRADHIYLCIHLAKNQRQRLRSISEKKDNVNDLQQADRNEEPVGLKFLDKRRYYVVTVCYVIGEKSILKQAEGLLQQAN